MAFLISEPKSLNKVELITSECSAKAVAIKNFTYKQVFSTVFCLLKSKQVVTVSV